MKIQEFGVMNPCTKSSESKCSQAVCGSVVCLSGNFKNPRCKVMKVTLNGSVGSMGVEDASTVGYPRRKVWVQAGMRLIRRRRVPQAVALGSCCASDAKEEPSVSNVKL